jgi:DNA-binding transcriptional ArsR family regulator
MLIHDKDKPVPQPPSDPSYDDVCAVRVVHLERVERARQEIVSPQRVERMALMFRIMGDPTRLRIIMALGGGEMCVCDLAAFLCLSESAVSHQLRRLRELTLVRQRRDGQVLYYALDDTHVAQMVATALAHTEE